MSLWVDRANVSVDSRARVYVCGANWSSADISIETHLCSERTTPPKKLLESRFSTPYTPFCLICTISSELTWIFIFNHLSEPGLISAGFRWTDSPPTRFQKAPAPFVRVYNVKLTRRGLYHLKQIKGYTLLILLICNTDTKTLYKCRLKIDGLLLCLVLNFVSGYIESTCVLHMHKIDQKAKDE